jgi:hypothetical protein
MVGVPADSIKPLGPLAWPAKDPDEQLDYGIDWSGRLSETDLIATSEWLDRGLLTIISQWLRNEPAKATYVWISGGKPDTTYFVTNRITTTEGRVMDQTVTITVCKSK